MRINLRILQGLCLSLALLFIGCATRSDTNEIKKAQDESKQILNRIESQATNIPSPVLYEIHDLARDKSVGFVGWGTHISTGDRIFLNDDIWDVKMVKVFTNPTGSSQKDVPIFGVTYIQVLVTFSGKAIDPKTKG